MGLSKSYEELEFFPGVMMPERHVVSGWTPETVPEIRIKEYRKPTKLIFIISKDTTIDTFSLLLNVLEVDMRLVTDHELFQIYESDISDELSGAQTVFLEEFEKNHVKWFSWRVF